MVWPFPYTKPPYILTVWRWLYVQFCSRVCSTGLIITDAQYGPVDRDEAVRGLDLDVTIPLQVLVNNSQLYIPGRRSKVRCDSLAESSDRLHFLLFVLGPLAIIEFGSRIELSRRLSVSLLLCQVCREQSFASF